MPAGQLSSQGGVRIRYSKIRRSVSGEHNSIRTTVDGPAIFMEDIQTKGVYMIQSFGIDKDFVAILTKFT